MSQLSIEEQMKERQRRLRAQRDGANHSSAANAVDVDMDMDMDMNEAQSYSQSRPNDGQTEMESKIDLLQQRMIQRSGQLESIKQSRDALKKRLEEMNGQITTIERSMERDNRELQSLLRVQDEQSHSHSHSRERDPLPSLLSGDAIQGGAQSASLDEELARSLQAQEHRNAERAQEREEAQARRRQQRQEMPADDMDIGRMVGAGMSGMGAMGGMSNPFTQLRIVSDNNGIRTVYSGGDMGGMPNVGMDDTGFMSGHPFPPMMFGGRNDPFMNDPFFRSGFGGMPLGFNIQQFQQTGPRAASSEQIESLPTDTFRAKPSQSNAEEHKQQHDSAAPAEADEQTGGEEEEDPNHRCCICLEAFKDGDAIRRLPCLHFFHTDEIDHWLRTSNVCPVCRTTIDRTQPPQ